MSLLALEKCKVTMFDNLYAYLYAEREGRMQSEREVVVDKGTAGGTSIPE